MTSGSSYTPPPAFGRLKVLHQIGAGVLGPVFRAHEDGGERLLAVKALTLDLTPEQAVQLAEQLQKIVRLALRHPCIPAPMAAGVEESVPYVAVPYVPGESLDAAIRQYGPAPAGDAIRLITHVADALDAAADAGVYHGSLHPRDILVTPGETHVTGLGIAQALGRVGLHGPIRRPYVAPEREGGEEWGACADIYSLGAIAYEVLTGRRALPGTDQPLPALAEFRAHNPVALREAFEAAMDPDPDRRPGRAREFAEAFTKALSESAGAGPSSSRQEAPRPRRARSRAPKLPGLDEPLAPSPVTPEAEERPAAPRKPPGAGAGRRVPPVVPVPAEPVSALPPESPADSGPEEAAPAVSDQTVLPPPSPVEEAAPVPEPVAPPAAAAVLAEAALRAVDPGPPPAELDQTRMAESPSGRPAEDQPEAGGAGEFALDVTELNRGAGPTPASVFVVDLGGLDYSLPPAEPPAEAGAGVPAVAVSVPGPAEPPRAAVRRRAPVRVPPPADAEESRPPRSRPAPRSVFDTPAEPAGPAERFPYEFAGIPGRRDTSRRPVIAGVLAGLVLGLVAGYWLGSRQASRSSGPDAAPTAGAVKAGTEPSAQKRLQQLPEAQDFSASLTSPPAHAASGPAARASAAAPPAAPPVPGPGDRAAAPARSPASPGTGSIAIVVGGPAANVFIDGRREGLTPRNLERVPLGSHTVRVTRPGYEDQEKRVTLSPEQPSARVEFTLRPLGASTPRVQGSGETAPEAAVAGKQSLVIETRPAGAKVRVGGRDYGVTPVTITPIRTGLHKIELRLDGYRLWAETITVKAGQVRRVAVPLERVSPR